MRRPKLRFVIGPALVAAALVYFGATGFEEGKAYYKTVAELRSMGNRALGKRLRVAGIVQDGSIERRDGRLRFVLVQGERTLPVVYRGTDPVPDTFEDGVEAVVEGRMTPRGTFEAVRIQAKCASKYEPDIQATTTGPR
jgi:cytochrome c-type biogenesis protein CcmE